MERNARNLDADRQVRTYLLVFLALAALTFATVEIASFRLAVLPAVVLALGIATVKGSLVASSFMHLLRERKLILAILALVLVLFLVILALPVLTQLDRVAL